MVNHLFGKPTGETKKTHDLGVGLLEVDVTLSSPFGLG